MTGFVDKGMVDGIIGSALMRTQVVRNPPICDGSLLATYIIHPCQYNGIKSRNLFPFQIITAKLCKKIQKNLIIDSAVHLVDQQYHPFAGSLTERI